jgi:molecular chaperone GrpE
MSEVIREYGMTQNDEMRDEAVATEVREDGDAEDEVAKLQARAADYEDRWKRSAAEFINYKRRTEQERSELSRTANGTLIREFLPVLDDLERTLANVPPEQAESKWVEGVNLVARKFRTLLERQGVTSIETVGQPFDPAIHEAVGGSGTHVTEEYQRGYRFHGRTLRPAIVIVGDAPADAAAGQEPMQA